MTEGPRPLPRNEPQAVVSELSGRRFFALIINGDTEERHLNNVTRAREALKSNLIPDGRITVASAPLGNATSGSLGTIAAGLSGMMAKGDGLIVYVTGHGSPEGLVLSGGEILPHAEFISLMKPFRAFKTLFIFDSCYSGALPGRLVEAGFDSTAMAPVAEGSESQCQLFSPYLWSAVKSGMDSNGDGKTTMEEVFRSAMDVYNTKRAAAGMKSVSGVFDHPLPALRSLDQIKRGNVIVELSANWCEPCKMQRQELNNLRAIFGERLNVLTLDVETSPLLREFNGLAGRTVSGTIPQIYFFRDGKTVHSRQGLTQVSSLVSDSLSAFGFSKDTNTALVRNLERNLGAKDQALAMGSATALLGFGVVNGEVIAYFQKRLKEGRQVEIAEMMFELFALPAFPLLAEKLGPDWISGVESVIQTLFHKKIQNQLKSLQISYGQSVRYHGDLMRNVGMQLRVAQGMPPHLRDNPRRKADPVPGIGLHTLREEMQPFIDAQLANPQSRELATYAIEMAGIVSSYGSVRRLEDIASNEKEFDSIQRESALLALGDIADKSSLPTLLKFARSKDARIVAGAVRALSRLREGEGPGFMQSLSLSDSAIIMALGHKSEFVRAASLMSLADIADRKFVTFMARLKKDPDSRVRICLLNALAQTRGPEAMGVLGDMARSDPDSQIREAASVTLEELEKGQK
jgi:thiol-disulfide isomerase/thioredoxin